MSKHQIGYLIFGLSTLIYFVGFIFYDWPLLYYFFLFILWGIVVLWGSFTIQSNYHIKAFCKIKTTQKVVALTFDDGPTVFTPKVLDLLLQYNCKATFFCVGKQIEQYPSITSRIVKEGHIIGNHTFYHSNNNGFKRKEELIKEWEKTDNLVHSFTGSKPQFFRPPFGVTNPQIMQTLKVTKHQVIGWSIRSLDTVIRNEDRLFNRILRRWEAGSIILLHDSSEITVRVLERLLQFMQQENYKSVTISELLKLKT